MIIHLIEGFGYTLSGDRDTGIEILQNLAKFNPESPTVRFNYYTLSRLEGNDEVAIKSFFRGLDLIDASTEEISKFKIAYKTEP